jgi:hypothetical protein
LEANVALLAEIRTPTPDGGGYWLVASDGGVFAYRDAPYLGSPEGRRPSVVGMG